MIISGLQTGDTRWLAAHLQNSADNERIELVETSGTVATDIDGALAEFDAIASGTRARESVYAAFINPPEPLSRAQYARALFLIEQHLGLEGQPRVVVFHEKKGREHCHVVWSRIDLETMRAIQLSFDRQKLRRCAQDLAAEFGLELPPGLAQDRGAERFDDPPRPTRAEKAMQAQSGLSREERRAVITQCYRQADSPQAFVHALEAAGFMLARGSKRVFVVVDTAGHIHALARQIDGAKTRDVKKKLEGLALSSLPPAERAKVLMLQRAAAQQDALRVHAKKQKIAEAERERIHAIQRKRRATLDQLWQRMIVRQMHERKVMLAHLKALEERRIARRHFLAVGLALYLKKIAFIRKLLEYYEKKRRQSLYEFYRAMVEAVRRRHENEQQELRRRYEALARLEAQELKTFLQAYTGTVRFTGYPEWEYRGGRFVRTIQLKSDAFTIRPERAVDVTELAAALPRVPVNSGEISAHHGAPLVDMTGARITMTPFQENAVEITARHQAPIFNFGPASVTLTAFQQNALDITAHAGQGPHIDDTETISEDERVSEESKGGSQIHFQTGPIRL